MILWFSGLDSGVYLSGMMSSSWNISLLNVVNFATGTSMVLSSRYFNIPQNCLGLYFIIFGSSNWNCALYNRQFSLNLAYAFFVSICPLPCLCLHFLYSYFACLQVSSNHGARCFAHRFGFLCVFSFMLFITPAVFASSIRNYSIFSVRMLLSSSYYFVISSNAVANLVVEVCAFQLFALFMY